MTKTVKQYSKLSNPLNSDFDLWANDPAAAEAIAETLEAYKARPDLPMHEYLLKALTVYRDAKE